MSAFWLKLIALASMIIDHLVKAGIISQALFIDCFHMSIKSSFVLLEAILFVGRIAFPLYAFLIAEGCRKSRNIERYILRLLIFSAISEIPYDLALDPINQISSGIIQRISFLSHTNIFFTLALGAIAIRGCQILRDRKKTRWLSILPVAACAAIGAIIDADYSWLGVLLIVSAYVPQKKWTQVISMFAVLAVLYIGYASFWFQSFDTENVLFLLGSAISLVLILIYRGKQGPRMKWFFYISYPLHLAILFLMRWFIF